jgi:hypothetical protein
MLRERAETLGILESEAQDENEMLRFKCVSHEAELKMNGSCQHLQVIEALTQSNKSYKQKVAEL